jgi:hypothetical protein
MIPAGALNPMAKLIRHILLVLGTIAVLTPWAYPDQKTAPFRIRVVDRITGHGLPNVRVTVEDGTTGDTEFDGSLLFWLDTALMKQTVRFTIEHHGVLTMVRLPVSGGALVAVPVTAP